MAKLTIARIGRPVLRKVCRQITPDQLKEESFRKFMKDMVRSMHRWDGVGLAANQVGEDIAAIVLECQVSDRYPDMEDVPLQMYVNPKILSVSKETEEDWEGCLSIPGYRGRVSRAKSVTFEATTLDGKTVKKTVEGFWARIIQHEIDHINGFFYVDRMKNLKEWYHLDEFNRTFGTQVKDKT